MKLKPFSENTLLCLTSRLDREDNFVFLESSRLSEENHHSLLFTRPSSYLYCLPGDSAIKFLDRADHLRDQGMFLAGWLAYEFGYLLEPRLHHFLARNRNAASAPAEQPLAVLGVYDNPVVFNHKTGQFSSGSGWPEGEAEQTACTCTDLNTSISEREYLQAVRAVQEYILAGDTYQVNFTLHVDFHFQGSIAALYRTLRRNQSVGYSAWIRHNGRDVLSFSPELFFAANAERVRVRPMKGTMSRGRTNAEDKEQQEKLRSDPKNRSENVMIVDLLRNDIGRLLYEGGGGTVVPRSLFDVETYESLLQMTSAVDGIPECISEHIPGNNQDKSDSSNSPLSFRRLVETLFPCGSVTGAPKIRTMEIIHELEQQPRGVYCGAIGYTSREKSYFNVPIRTLELHNGQGRMGVGSGIVADSVPEAEWEECLLKGNFLTSSEPDFQLIETMLWRPDQGFFLLDYHLERLQDSAAYFHFFCEPDAIRLHLEQKVQKLKGDQGEQQQWRIRLLLHRDGRIETSAVPLPSPAPVSGKVIFSEHQVDAASPHRFHKTTRRELYNREYAAAAEQEYFDILFTNTEGQVTEGAVSNIFVARQDDDVLLTPPVSCGLLAGTYRRMLLEQGKAIEQALTVEDVLQAHRLYAANSVRGLVRVYPEQNSVNSAQ
ncbi:MAG: chorismate-binding protein [Candidatus Electrothrix sp. YB6]